MADAYFSEDSDFYGDENYVQQLEQQTKHFHVQKYWKHHDRDLNVIFPAPDAEVEAEAEAESPPPPIPKGGMHNRYEGVASAWQSHESVDEFLARMPVNGSSDVGHWLWVANPYADRDAEPESRDAKFMQLAPRLLKDYLKLKSQTTEDNPSSAPVVITRKLKPARDKLKDDILSLAKQTGMLSGKWMLFPQEKDAPDIWRRVVGAVIGGKLGIAAKIATDDPYGKGTRLICIYTKDFSDEDDVAQVVKQMKKLDMLPGDEKSIYYKCDAYTYLDINSQNEYGLSASLYASKDVLGEKTPAKKTARAGTRDQKKMSDPSTTRKAAGRQKKV